MFVWIWLFGVFSIGSAGFMDMIQSIPKPSEMFNNMKNAIFQNRCIEDLGCFYTGPPFYHPIYRPISLSPDDELKTKYKLYTPDNPRSGEDIDHTESSVLKSSLRPDLPVKVLVHGFRSALDEEDIRFKMRDALLNLSDFNIIIVDWTEHNQNLYHQAVSNARVVGAQLALLLKLIMKHKGIQPAGVHLIGHSLGAHVAGWAGEKIPNLGRITGLDPAGPYFQGADEPVRLDATDALFVDVIHTDAGSNYMNGLGYGDAIGHLDFYPNGGSRQPGCTYDSDEDSPSELIKDALADLTLDTCGHSRANELFLESMDNSGCRFVATLCDSYEDFESGNCPDSMVSEMGFHAREISGIPVKAKFFLLTNETSPFCCTAN